MEYCYILFISPYEKRITLSLRGEHRRKGDLSMNGSALKKENKNKKTNLNRGRWKH
jgi:hypothetical protein